MGNRIWGGVVWGGRTPGSTAGQRTRGGKEGRLKGRAGGRIIARS